MSEVYAVPGVYVEEIHGTSLSIQSGETAVPVFVGIFNDKNTPDVKAANQELTCVRVDSWLDFTQRFAPSGYLTVTLDGGKGQRVTARQYKGANSVRLFFENGGGACYILAVSADAKVATKSLAQLLPAIEQHPEITLLCWCEYAGPEIDQQVYTALSAGAAVGNNAGRFLLMDAWPEGKVDTPSAWQFKTHQVADRTQAASYFPAFLTGFTHDYRDYMSRTDWRGYEHLVNVCGFTEEQVGTLKELALEESFRAQQFVTLAELREKVNAAADDKAAKGAELLQSVEQIFLAELSALPTRTPPVILRASVAMAGIYARVDRERGVWKAPANVEVSSVTALVAQGVDGKKAWHNAVPVRVDDGLNEKLVDAQINAIRMFSGQGILVWGGRTMAPATNTDWRYVSVRRLFNTIERDVRAALRAVVFEPNSPVVWETVRGALDHYLDALWRKQALQGDSAAQAYFVQIGLGTTMSKDDIDQGRMIVKIGVAAVRPAEFIVLTLTQNVLAG